MVSRNTYSTYINMKDIIPLIYRFEQFDNLGLNSGNVFKYDGKCSLYQDYIVTLRKISEL